LRVDREVVLLRLLRASPYQRNFREDEVVGRDSVELPRFACLKMGDLEVAFN
jgi:hypothetical protein